MQNGAIKITERFLVDHAMTFFILKMFFHEFLGYFSATEGLRGKHLLTEEKKIHVSAQFSKIENFEKKNLSMSF